MPDSLRERQPEVFTFPSKEPVYDTNSDPARPNVNLRFAPSPNQPQQHTTPHHNKRQSRARTLSISAQHAVKAVYPPISVKLIVLCLLWYCSSAISSNLSKSILQIFKYPVSLTMVQFVYAAFFASAAVSLATYQPSFASLFPKGSISTRGMPDAERAILVCVAPMAGFQIIGHIFSHSATSQIPVSLVHAIKSLSPLLTVLAYSTFFRVKYNMSTYLSLIPLTTGVIMACSAEFKAKPLAISYAFMSCCIFVSQNIWSKKLLTTGKTYSQEGSEKNIDKITIIFWCAVVGFMGTFPIWLLSDGKTLFKFGGFALLDNKSPFYLFSLMTLNGFSHFCQNLLSFMILGSISTVSYSIASLLKRVFVMTAAIVWFRQSVSATQGWGILLTFIGLYLYDRFGSKNQKQETNNDSLVLPK